jgi:putative Mg2+ transporter-C (MgtC) family protein
MSLSEWTLIGRIALATLLGYVVGYEREYRRKAAGERTFALIALGTAAMVGYASTSLSPEATSRIIQGVAAGIGFVGAGLIFQRTRRQVRGLTTAAAVWAVAAVAVLCGAGAYGAAIASTSIVLVVLELDRIPGLRRLSPSGLAPPAEERTIDD